MSLKPGPTLLALTYIDLIVMLSRHNEMARDAQSIFDTLQELDPKWYSKLDDSEAKAAMKQAASIVTGHQKTIAIQLPGELVL